MEPKTIQELQIMAPELVEFAIERYGIVYYLINPDKVKKLNKFNALSKIKQLHHQKLDVYELMHVIDDIQDLFICDQELDSIELKLQKLWGFEQDPNYHKFWRRPKCTCPKMDNEDHYPTGMYILSSDCYHWLGIK